MGTKTEALGNLMVPYEGNICRSLIAIALVIAWIVIVIGQAYGWVSPEFNNPYLLSVVMGILGYLFGKEVSSVEDSKNYSE